MSVLIERNTSDVKRRYLQGGVCGKSKIGEPSNGFRTNFGVRLLGFQVSTLLSLPLEHSRRMYKRTAGLRFRQREREG